VAYVGLQHCVRLLQVMIALALVVGRIEEHEALRRVRTNVFDAFLLDRHDAVATDLAL